MIKKQKLERRKNVRVSVRVRAEIKCLDAEESRKINSRKAMVYPEQTDILARIESESPGLIDPSISNLAEFIVEIEEKRDPSIAYLSDSLIRIDEKLDHIIDAISGGKKKDVLNVKDTIDLSGTGLSVTVTDYVENGQLVHLILRISGFPLGKFISYGEVIRVTPKTEGSRELYNLGIEFLHISDKEKEGLIAYIFCQQRKMIRQSSK